MSVADGVTDVTSLPKVKARSDYDKLGYYWSRRDVSLSVKGLVYDMSATAILFHAFDT